jgi:hypothetical protein
MPAFRKYSLEVKTTASAGTPFPCRNLDQKWVQIGGTMGGGRNLRIEGSMNDVDFEEVNGGITATGFYPVCQTLSMVRIRTALAGSGNTTATLVGRDLETYPR